MNILLFYPLSALVILLACGVIFAGNTVHCAVLLVSVMVGISGLFLCLNCELLAMMQVLIYAGAIMVLFLFVVMTVDTRKEEKFVSYSRFAQTSGIFLAGAMGLLLLFVAIHFSAHLPATDTWLGDAKSMGNAFLQQYALPFEAITLILLTAMVGVVAMSREPLYKPPQHRANPHSGGNQV